MKKEFPSVSLAVFECSLCVRVYFKFNCVTHLLIISTRVGMIRGCLRDMGDILFDHVIAQLFHTMLMTGYTYFKTGSERTHQGILKVIGIKTFLQFPFLLNM